MLNISFVMIHFQVFMIVRHRLVDEYYFKIHKNTTEILDFRR